MACNECKSRNLFREEDTGNTVCFDCGKVQEFDNYDAQLGGIRGPQGTNIRVGHIGTGSVLAYKDKKIFEANKVIEDITSRLNLSDKRDEIRTMIKDITEGEFGLGIWFEVLIGACSYVLMRKEAKNVLPMKEVAAAVGCDLYELGGMIKRVVEHLRWELPEFDLVGLFTRSVKNMRLSGVERDKKERITEQGIFLMNCSLKWFLSTGRRPLPLVVAVLALVAQVNGVTMRIEDLAKEAEVALSTCKKRYRELLEKLVKVAHEVGLPWGKDITVKNVIEHAGTIIGCMEAKSLIKSNKGAGDELVHGRFCLEDIVRDCLSEEARHDSDGDDARDDVSQYFEVGGESRPELLDSNHSKGGEISVGQLSMIYKKFRDEVDCGNLGKQSQSKNIMQKRNGFEMVSSEFWWKGKSELSHRLLLKEVLEKDVGLDALPPCYIKGCKAVERRREKIKAAKTRIDMIKRPWDIDNGVTSSSDSGNTCKKRKIEHVSDIDWEDLIIETLILHLVKDEEIEKGYYKTLLDLHVFKSGEV